MTAPYTLEMPESRRTGHVFASPHSGRDYPSSFLASSVLDALQVRSSEDAFVDLLFADAPRLGAPLLSARAPRAYVDLNRGADELDPAVIADLPRQLGNPRVSSGLGVIPRVVANGRAIYSGKITRSAAEERIRRHWLPYHACLRRLLDDSQSMFGEAILVDCHSMPHEAIETSGLSGRARPDIVLGDRFGSAARSEVVDRIEEAFAREGLRVARNAPFAGAYIAQAYGRPARGQHVVQVEIDRALYLDEATIQPNDQFGAFRKLISRVIAGITGVADAPARLAAE